MNRRGKQAKDDATRSLVALVAAVGCLAAEPKKSPLLGVKRVHIEELAGDQSAAQIRDMIINALQSAGLFLVTENPDKADAYLRGSAEDIVFTDTFQTSEGINARASLGGGTGTSRSTTDAAGRERGRGRGRIREDFRTQT